MNKIRIVTAADSTYFTRLCGMIGSVIKWHPDSSIIVYDIGLTDHQRVCLWEIPQVQLFIPEDVNGVMKIPIKKHEIGHHRSVPGIYTWKPVAVYEQLKLSDLIIWMDAGCLCTGDLTPVMEHTERNGHLFVGTTTVGWQTPKTVSDYLNLSPEILAKQSLNSSFMCIHERETERFVKPCYEMAHDYTLFIDDGTAAGGPQSGRHDQTIFGIQAAKENMTVQPSGLSITLDTHSGPKEVSIVANFDDVKENTIVYQCRGNSNAFGDLDRIKDKYGWIE
jgi:hypothetical protein